MKRCVVIMLVALTVLMLSLGGLAKTKVVFRTDWFPKDFKYNDDDVIGKARYQAFLKFKELHPEYDIQVEYLSYNPWIEESPRILTTMIQGGGGPSWYPAFDDDAQGMIRRGFFADITDVVKNWEPRKYIPEPLMASATKNGRIYAIPANYLNYFAGFAFRKDWMKDAGIEISKDWTIDEFRAIAKKLTDPVKKRWGFGLPGNEWARRFWGLWARIHGIPSFIPDRTGKHVYELNPDLIEVAKFYHDVVWKDKSVLTGIDKGWFDLENDFRGGRIGMHRFLLAQFLGEVMRNAGQPEFLQPSQIGYRLHPRRYDLVLVDVGTNFWGVNPSGSPAEIKARAEFLLYIMGGEGRRMENEARAKAGILPDEIPSLYKSADYPNPKMKEIPPDFEEALAMVGKLEMEPDSAMFGIDTSGYSARYNHLVNAFVQKLITNPNADIQKEFNTFKASVDNTVLNQKPTATGDIAGYWRALNEYYKKYFPKYYREYFAQLYKKVMSESK